MNKLNSVLFIFLLAFCLFISTAFNGCASSKRAQIVELKQCPERICAGDIWPGDYTNCTCRNY